MKLSFNWLKEHVDLEDKTVNEVADLLTEVGLEVEEQYDYSNSNGSLNGVVVGHVLETTQHPNADKLKITRVDIGLEEPLQIVCGAPNVAAGQKVPVATVGSVLTFTDGNVLKIKRGKIRGEVSVGMICAEDELGVGESHDGIMVLDQNAVVGTPFEELLNVYNDNIIEVGLTPNRVDAACHRGAAIDLSAKLQRPLKEKKINAISNHNDSSVVIDIQDKEACPRYAAIVVRNIEVQDSPEWLQNKLKAIGLQPINNVVDVTNFVMHDLGQPLHGFDLSEIEGKKIVVRRSKNGEKLVTLDEKERELDGTELLICDSERPLAFAGVLGGLNSGINDKTTDVLIESAFFNPSVVRRTAKRHQISTDASFRFERGADPNMVLTALNYAAELIAELGGGNAEGFVNDNYAAVQIQCEIDFDLSYFEKVSGIKISSSKIETILTYLGFKVAAKNEVLNLLVPTNKPDVQRPIDVVEEILRIYGYNNVPLDTSLKISIPDNKKIFEKKLYDKVANILNGEGFFELKTTPFTTLSENGTVEILNPLSAEMTHLKNDQLASGLTALAHNINRQSKNLKFYEIANEYSISEGTYVENKKLTIWITGQELLDDSWFVKNRKTDFHFAKMVATKIFNNLGVKHSPLAPIEDDDRWLYALGDKEGFVKVGQLSLKYADNLDVNQPVFAAQIDYRKLLKLFKKVRVRFKELSKFPQMTRDLSFVLKQEAKFDDLKSAISNTKTKFLKNVDCFDLYRGKPLEKGYVSYGLRFVFENQVKTLNDKQVEFEMSQITKVLEDIGCQIRK